MARNSEKAHSMLFRFRAAQAAEAGIIDISRTRRPKLITSVTSIPVCEKWRGQVLKEISRKVTKIQDEALSDYQIRDLNDEINKAMREKYMWEKQIRDLGGPNYMRGGRVLDEEGREVPGGGKGYRYFGRAKELPGVKELFERQERPEDDDGARKGGEKRSELRQKVDAGYYGYNLDEEDGTLLAYEAKKEKEAWDHFMTLPDDLSEKPGKTQKEWIELPGDAGDGVRWQVPTLEEVNNELVERRRRKLLEKLG
ncbi:NineTeen Complex (NTC) component [Didymella glomerata]|jgi:pre-mRNA-splicing factor ISY1|uniref:NineTeen Complex (NTC) component n=1 Tax=Didymella glomerata TaxID=749621 RepID=A0A9W9C138_9PLEO|nr:NineTeen Complex (NTC) component [Didymella glomerata]